MQLWFDFASTYSYVAALRVEEVCARVRIPLEYKPFLLGPLFQEQLGIKDSPFNVQPVRGRYMWRDLERLCDKYALPWRKPSAFPRGSVLAARMALCVAESPGPLVRAIFRANFADDRDIADPEVMRSVADSLGLDGARLVERAAAPEIKAALRANTDEARRLGLFGAPSFVAEGELFFGQDRLEDAADWEATRGSRRPAPT